MNAREFVIVTSQRTGSTLLVRSLDAVPEIFCAGELFHTGPRTHHHEFQYPYQKVGRSVLARASRRFLQRSRVERHLEFFYREAGKNVRAVGFKLMVSQADRYPAIIGCLRERDVARIFLHRRNTFDAALSYCMAAMTGRYHSDKPAGIANQVPVTIDEAEFGRSYSACAADLSRLLELHSALGGLLVAYEDLSRDWDGSISKVGDHVGVTGLRVGQSLERLSGTEGPRVANAEVLRRRFSAT